MLTSAGRVAALAVPMIMVAAAATPALAAPGDTPPALQVIATNLANPRGLNFGPDGKLYVTEAGTGGTAPCLPTTFGDAQLCMGLTGAITEIDKKGQRKAVTGLPSLVSADLSSYGPHDVVFRPNGEMLIAEGYSTGPQFRDQLGAAGAVMGTVIHIDKRGHERSIGDLSAFELANNPDHIIAESQPYALATYGKDVYVVDAAANDVLRVDPKGKVSVQYVFPMEQTPAPPEWGLPPGTMVPVQPVPSTIVRGPDGALYIGQLTGHPFPSGDAKVWRLVPGHAPTVYESGFTNIVDILFDKRGRLVVLEIARNGLESGDPSGALLRVERNGNRTELAGPGLITPTGVALGPDGAYYVANKGIGVGEVVRISAKR